MPVKRKSKKTDTTTKTTQVPWKEVESEADLKGFKEAASSRGDVAWNSFCRVPDLTRWRVVECEEKSTIQHPNVQEALALAYVRSRDEKDAVFRVPKKSTRGLTWTHPSATVCIPDHEMRLVHFRPSVTYVIPNAPSHAVQRRAHRWTGAAPTTDQVKTLLAHAALADGDYMVALTPQHALVARQGKIALHTNGREEEVAWP